MQFHEKPVGQTFKPTGDKTATLEIRSTIGPGSWPANRHRRLCGGFSCQERVYRSSRNPLYAEIEKRGGASISCLTSLIVFPLSSRARLLVESLLIIFLRPSKIETIDKNSERRLNNGRNTAFRGNRSKAHYRTMHF